MLVAPRPVRAGLLAADDRRPGRAGRVGGDRALAQAQVPLCGPPTDDGSLADPTGQRSSRDPVRPGGPSARCQRSGSHPGHRSSGDRELAGDGRLAVGRLRCRVRPPRPRPPVAGSARASRRAVRSAGDGSFCCRARALAVRFDGRTELGFHAGHAGPAVSGHHSEERQAQIGFRCRVRLRRTGRCWGWAQASLRAAGLASVVVVGSGERRASGRLPSGSAFASSRELPGGCRRRRAAPRGCSLSTLAVSTLAAALLGLMVPSAGSSPW